MRTTRITSLVLFIVIGRAASEDSTPVPVIPYVSATTGERLLKELILKSDITPEDGKCFVARVRLNRRGDRDFRGSFCSLLEDGKPLPHPRSLHASIRKEGLGRYSHWTATHVYLSASDSSDPRTNGRRYELVSKESFRQRTARTTLTAGHSSLSIVAADDRSVRPIRIVMRNLDQQVSVSPHLRRSDDPDLTSVESIISSITNDQMSDEDRATAIWKFLIDWRYHDYPAERRAEMHDPVKLINVYGYGFCDDSAAAFCVLASKAGMKTRSVGLSGHVVAEAFYDNAWHMFDPDHQVRYRTKDGRVAGVSELEFQPELITSQPDDPLGFPSRRMAEMYTTRRDNRPFQAASSDPMELRPVLDPGDQVVFDFTRRQRVHRRAYRDKPLPLMFGNGILSQNKLLSKTNLRSNARVIHVQWPYVILGGQIRIASKADDGASTVEASADGGNFAALPVISINNGLATSLDSWIDAQPSAVYEYWLRIRRNDGTDPAIGIKDVSVDTEFQFAPRAHAQIKPGMNGFVVAVHGKDSQLPENWRGLDVELVWDEVRDK